MKAHQRLVYKELSNLVDAQLCSFCKHAEWEGCCEEGKDCECKHPLEYRFDYLFSGWGHGPEPGDDCWGFRPKLSTVDMADVTGMILANGWNSWSWGRENGNILVYGRTT